MSSRLHFPRIFPENLSIFFSSSLQLPPFSRLHQQLLQTNSTIINKRIADTIICFDSIRSDPHPRLSIRRCVEPLTSRTSSHQLPSAQTSPTRTRLALITPWARLHPKPLEAVQLASFPRGRPALQSRKQHPGHLVKQPPKTQGPKQTDQQKATDPKTQVSWTALLQFHQQLLPTDTISSQTLFPTLWTPTLRPRASRTVYNKWAS